MEFEDPVYKKELWDWGDDSKGWLEHMVCMQEPRV